MSQPTHRQLPPAYRAHRGLLVIVLVLAALAFVYQLTPEFPGAVRQVQSMIDTVVQTWAGWRWTIWPWKLL
jgi:hypothetical protein